MLLAVCLEDFARILQRIRKRILLWLGLLAVTFDLSDTQNGGL